MRIVRTLDPKGHPVLAEEIHPNEARLLEGDLFSGLRPTDQRFPLCTRLAPLQPTLIIGIAQNYRAHALEMKGVLPQRPVFFIKMPGSLQDPDKPILLPRTLHSNKVDYEAELAVVLGRSCRNITPRMASEAILGYTAANDVSARDWQKEWGGGQFCRGKGFDTFCPLGPALLTLDEFANPDALRIRSFLNGDCVQDGNTADMVFSVPELIAFLSGDTTLPAGTVILTGTPAGVGDARHPPRYLQPGDRFEVEIEQIGRLANPVQAAQIH